MFLLKSWQFNSKSFHIGSIYVAQDGHVFFYGYGYTGTGFEIKYECPEPCKDEKSSKYCKKALKKGKCKKAKVADQCKKTCDKCDTHPHDEWRTWFIFVLSKFPFNDQQYK